jgi:transposase
LSPSGRLAGILDSLPMKIMSGQSSPSATSKQKAALAELARSELGGEADKARAMLLTLSGWTSPEVAEVFGVIADFVRHWRQWFAEGGVEALRSAPAADPSAAKGARDLAVASAVLREPVENRSNWTLPRLCAEIERQTGTRISRSRLSALIKCSKSIRSSRALVLPLLEARRLFGHCGCIFIWRSGRIGRCG